MPYDRAMAVVRMDHVGVVVEDLASAIAFFRDLGLDVEGEASVEGQWVDRLAGMDGVRADIAMMRTPDGNSRLELTTYRSPAAPASGPAPPNTLGLRNLMFLVDDIDDTVARLRAAHGAELLGEVAQYEEIYRLCYLRGPAGIIVALAEELG